MKTCRKCNKNLPENQFSKSEYKRIYCRCLICVKEYNTNYRYNNKEKIKQNKRKYRETNKEKVKIAKRNWWIKNHQKNKDNKKKYYQNNKNKIKDYQLRNNKTILNNQVKRKKILRKTSPKFKLKEYVSASIRSCLKKRDSNKNKNSFLKYVDYSIDSLKSYLQLLFEPWMNWNNWGKYNANTWNDNDSSTWTWQLDHIIPQSYFDYKSMEDDQFKICWSLDNLRPYSAKLNNLENNKRTEEDIFKIKNEIKKKNDLKKK